MQRNGISHESGIGSNLRALCIPISYTSSSFISDSDYSD
jgi:hypothetical protein